MVKKPLVVRQPLYDHSLSVVAYQLLFYENTTVMGDETQHFDLSEIFSNPEQLSLLTEGKPAHLMLTYHQLLEVEALPPPSQAIVINVDVFWLYNHKVIGLVHELKEKGYAVALRNVNIAESMHPIMNVVDMMHFTVGDAVGQNFSKELELFKATDCSIVAEELHEPKQFDALSDLDFEMFHGRFMTTPALEKGEVVSVSRNLLLQLVSSLQREDIDSLEVAQLLEKDANLSYQLLTVCNSAYFNLPRALKTIHEAVVLMGTAQMRAWANILVMNSLSKKPHALIVHTMLRGKLCELVAGQTCRADRGSAFTVGMFSLLDAILDNPLESIIAPLPLNDEIKSAILGGSGPLGEILSIVVQFENAHWDNLDRVPISLDILSSSYFEALHWVSEICMALRS